MRMLIFMLTIMALTGAVVGQDLVKGIEKGGPVNLSGLSGDIFDGAFFVSDGWTFDSTSYGMTPSQSAFLKDSPKDGKPIGNVTKKAPLRCGGM